MADHGYRIQLQRFMFLVLQNEPLVYPVHPIIGSTGCATEIGGPFFPLTLTGAEEPRDPQHPSLFLSEKKKEIEKKWKWKQHVEKTTEFSDD